MLTFIRYIEVCFTFAFLDCVRYNEDFVKSRFVISRYVLRLRFWIVFVITRISLNRGSLYRGMFYVCVSGLCSL